MRLLEICKHLTVQVRTRRLAIWHRRIWHSLLDIAIISGETRGDDEAKLAVVHNPSVPDVAFVRLTLIVASIKSACLLPQLMGAASFRTGH